MIIAVVEYAFAGFIAAKLTLSEVFQQLIDGSKSPEQIDLTELAINLAFSGYIMLVLASLMIVATLIPIALIAILFGWRVT